MPVENLYGDFVPTLTGLDDATYSLGTAFIVDVPGEILGARIYIGTPPSTTSFALLYRWDSDTTGTEIGRKQAGTFSPSSWNNVLFDSPVPIDAETRYVIAWGPTNNYSATPQFFSEQLINGHIRTPAIGDTAIGRFIVANEPAYPSIGFNGNGYFVDLLFQAEGEEEVSYLRNSFFFGAAG